MNGTGELLVRGSVWLALFGYLAGALHAWTPGLWGSRWPTARLLWTAGLAAYLVHVVSAFHVFYDWSQTVAWRETARQTAEMTGQDSGAGLLVNYLFTLVWIVDAVWWWAAPESHGRRRAAIAATIHGFMFFIVFNGSVVFGRGPVRIFGALIILALIATWAAERARRPRSR